VIFITVRFVESAEYIVPSLSTAIP
jgi:hypothetical protein